jgi:hypothetical protein
MSLWHVADQGRRLGPFSDDELRAARDRGAFAKARVWREGMSDWAPIAEYFPRPRAAPKRGGLGVAVSMLATLVFFAAAVASFVLVYIDTDFVPLGLMTQVWIGCGVVLVLTSLCLPLMWWKRSGRSEAGGMVRIMVVLLAIAGVSLAGLELFQSAYIGRIAAASEGMRDYRFVYDPAAKALRVDGQIGPGFARGLKAEFDRHDVRRVDITSRGGLVNEAMISARFLETRPSLEVAARSQCASACIIVLMGGSRRLADYDMDIHFHAVDTVADLDSDWWDVMTGRQGQEAQRYMERRGASKAALDAAARLGAGKLYRVPSVDLVEQGMLTGLLDSEGQPITPAVARALMRDEGWEPAPAAATPNL